MRLKTDQHHLEVSFHPPTTQGSKLFRKCCPCILLRGWEQMVRPQAQKPSATSCPLICCWAQDHGRQCNHHVHPACSRLPWFLGPQGAMGLNTFLIPCSFCSVGENVFSLLWGETLQLFEDGSYSLCQYSVQMDLSPCPHFSSSSTVFSPLMTLFLLL